MNSIVEVDGLFKLTIIQICGGHFQRQSFKPSSYCGDFILYSNPCKYNNHLFFILSQGRGGRDIVRFVRRFLLFLQNGHNYKIGYKTFFCLRNQRFDLCNWAKSNRKGYDATWLLSVVYGHEFQKSCKSNSCRYDHTKHIWCDKSRFWESICLPTRYFVQAHNTCVHIVQHNRPKATHIDSTPVSLYVCILHAAAMASLWSQKAHRGRRGRNICGTGIVFLTTQTFNGAPHHSCCCDAIVSDTRIPYSTGSLILDSESNRPGTRFCPALIKINSQTNTYIYVTWRVLRLGSFLRIRSRLCVVGFLFVKHLKNIDITMRVYDKPLISLTLL